MTLIAGIIIGVLAMWLRERALAKPSSPLLRLSADELREMLRDAQAAHKATRDERLQLIRDGYGALAHERATRCGPIVREIAELRDALRIVEARSVEVKTPQQGVCR